jgi:hypothetical protein
MLPKGIRKAVVFMGARRSGKTWRMYQDIRNRVEQHIEPTKNVYINFADDRLINTTIDHMQSLGTVRY